MKSRRDKKRCEKSRGASLWWEKYGCWFTIEDDKDLIDLKELTLTSPNKWVGLGGNPLKQAHDPLWAGRQVIQSKPSSHG